MKMDFGLLTKEERAEYMRLQTAPHLPRMGGGGYLPDDCSECDACGQPMLGYPGLCQACYSRWLELRKKATPC